MKRIRGTAERKDVSLSLCSYDTRLRKVVDFRLPDLEGKPVRFQDLDADFILLDFWGTWCAPCLESIPHLVSLQKEYGPRRLRVVGIACEQVAPEPAEGPGRRGLPEARDQLRRPALGDRWQALSGPGVAPDPGLSDDDPARPYGPGPLAEFGSDPGHPGSARPRSRGAEPKRYRPPLGWNHGGHREHREINPETESRGPIGGR